MARGECDHTISEIVASITRTSGQTTQAPGVTFMGRGALIRTPDQGPVKDLDRLPFPIQSAPIHRQNSPNPVLTSVEAVPSNAATASLTALAKESSGRERWRASSPLKLVTVYGKTHFRFEHDLSTLNRKWLIRLCEALEREKLNVTWECFSRIDTIDEEMIDVWPAPGAITSISVSRADRPACSSC